MKILFIFPNLDTGGYKPVGLTTLMNLCCSKGHSVRLFDTSFIDTRHIHSDLRYKGITEAGYEVLNFREVDVSPYNLVQEKIDPNLEFKKMLEEFRPDVVGVSVLSIEFSLSVYLLRKVKEYNPSIITIIGGIHTFADPQGCIEEKSIDIVCIGEGEIPLLTLLEKLEAKQPYEHIPGLWVKRNGNTFKNPAGQTFNALDTLPYLDYDFYDKRLLYRLYDGNVFRSSDHAVSRGCYQKCIYCLYKTMREFNSDNMRMRRYSVDRIIEELVYLKKKYNLTFNRFHDATFLAVSKTYLQDFAKLYAKYVDIPCVIDASPETVTEEKARALKEMNCVSISLGVETGNEKFRYEVLNKRVSNETILRAFGIVNNLGIRTVSFLLIGFPFETREIIQETIELVREARVQSPAIGFVYPFKGTKLREIAVQNKLFDPSIEVQGSAAYSRGLPIIKNPYISEKEYISIYRTFVLYVKFPRAYWPEIKRAEEWTENGNKVYQKFAEIYRREDLYNTYLPEDATVRF